ncbi:hypothetical protein D9M70_484870 [compost metagenome]
MLALQARQVRPEPLGTVVQHAPVQLELALAGTAAHADTALLPLQVAPGADQPRGAVRHLRQLHLHLADVALRALAEDIEDQAGAVDHVPVQEALEVALLRRAECRVEHDHVGIERVGGFLQLLGLARADEQRRVRPRTAARQRMHRQRAGGGGQQGELAEAFLEVMLAEIDADEDGARRGSVGSSSGIQGMARMRWKYGMVSGGWPTEDPPCPVPSRDGCPHRAGGRSGEMRRLSGRHRPRWRTGTGHRCNPKGRQADALGRRPQVAAAARQISSRRNHPRGS